MQSLTQTLIKIIELSQEILLEEFKVGDKVFVPHLNLHGEVRLVINTQIEIMLENNTYIQTTSRSLDKPYYNEESIKTPLKECSNRSSPDELSANKYPHQLSMF